MTSMNISLPKSPKDLVDEQVNQRGHGANSEHVRELIRKEQDRLQLRSPLLTGKSSAPTKPLDDAYFDSVRGKVRTTEPSARL
jgi:antitoxin ParD1/3/4